MKAQPFGFVRNFKFEYKITLTYFIFGFLWILFSDKVLDLLVPNDSLLTEFQTFKGSFFIIITSGFLYLLVKRHMQKLMISESQRIDNESHYRALFNDNFSVILLINPGTGKIEDANQSACVYYGWTHTELCKKNIYEINTLDVGPINTSLEAVLSENQNHFEFKHRLANGDVRDVEVFSGPIRTRNKTMIYSHVHDITEQKIVREIIRKNEERYRTTLDQMLEGCQIIGFDWKYIYLNNAAQAHNRRPNTELMGHRYMDIWPGIEETKVFQIIKKTLEERTFTHFENEFVFPDGSLGWFDLSIQPVPEGVFILSIDITERKRKEQQLFESEFRFSRLWENGPFGLMMVNQEFQYENVNPMFCKMLGYSEAELKQLTFKDISHPDDLVRDIPNIRKLINKEISVYQTEKRYIRKDGQVIWGALTVTANYDKEGQFLYNLAIVEDISRRKQAEEDLKKSKKLLSETESVGKVGGWEFSIDTLITTWTDEVFRIHEVDFNFTHNVNTGINFYTPASKPIIEQAVQRAIEFGESFDLELEIISAKGNMRKVNTIGKADMEHRRVYGFFQDITDRKQAEEAIRKSEHEFRTLAESMPQIVWVTRADGFNIYFNQQWMDYTGMTLEESYGHGWNKPFHPDDQQRAWDTWQTAVNNNEIYSIETRLRRFDGEFRWWLVRGVPLIDENGTILKWFGTCTDIEEIKRTENELAESEETYRMLFESINDAVLVAQLNDDQSFNYINVNDIACKLYGYSREEFLTRTPDDIISVNGKKDLKERIQKQLNNKITLYENEHVKKDGQNFPVEISIRSTQIRNKPIFTAIVRDITERRKAEEEIIKLNAGLELKVGQRTAQLEASNKELEAFSYSVSHDLRAPLRHINGFSEILIKNHSGQLPEDALKHLNTIIGSARKMGTLIDDLLNFSRTGRTELKKSTLEMNQVVEDAMSQVKPSSEQKVKWDISALPKVYGDYNLLRQVWINLIDNALKYTRSKDTAVIQIGYKEEKGEIVYYIQDNGVGFDMKYAQNLFGVFQRLHSSSEFEGTGIGLANVQRIILRHGGRTWAEAEIDKGAIFYFSIPKEQEDKL